MNARIYLSNTLIILAGVVLSVLCGTLVDGQNDSYIALSWEQAWNSSGCDMLFVKLFLCMALGFMVLLRSFLVPVLTVLILKFLYGRQPRFPARVLDG